MQWACTRPLELVADLDTSVDNLDRLPVAAGHFPAGTSVNTLFHWKQQVQSGGSFQKYDYGKDNQKIYGQSTPPKYNPALITENVALFVGTSDQLADLSMLVDSSARLEAKIKNSITTIWAT